VVSLVHTSLGSSYLIAHVLHSPPPPRAQLCKRSCSNKHTHTLGPLGERRRGVTTHLPTVRLGLGLQSECLQFNQRSYRRVVESIRGVKECARGVPYPHASECPSPKQNVAEGQITAQALANRTDSCKHSPGDPMN
jgi:hypothetical protein